MIRREDRRRPRPRRIGFTLVELMVVIAIIGILVALLLPVIVGAVRRANDARVAGDIQTIAAGLAKFKDTYGEFPPSRVILSEQGIYSNEWSGAVPTNGVPVRPTATDNTTLLSAVPAASWYGLVKPTAFGSPDVSFGELATRSLRALQKFFPRAVLAPVDANGGGLAVADDYWPDFNGNAGNLNPDGSANTAPDGRFLYLEGHECLVFFLGGITSPTKNTNGTTGYGMSGFGKEPRFPFKNPGGGGVNITTTNRTTAAYEFKGDRLVDEDGDGIPGYLDATSSSSDGRFYAYFVSYGAAGYDPNDNNVNSLDNLVESDGANPVGIQFRVGHPVLGGTATTASPAPNPYTTSLPTPINVGAGTFNASQPAAYMNANSFQLLSAGGDRLFGPGGVYSSSGDKLPLYPNPPYTQPAGIREREYDNVTNFTSGRLN